MQTEPFPKGFFCVIDKEKRIVISIYEKQPQHLGGKEEGNANLPLKGTELLEMAFGRIWKESVKVILAVW